MIWRNDNTITHRDVFYDSINSPRVSSYSRQSGAGVDGLINVSTGSPSSQVYNLSGKKNPQTRSADSIMANRNRPYTHGPQRFNHTLIRRDWLLCRGSGNVYDDASLCIVECLQTAGSQRVCRAAPRRHVVNLGSASCHAPCTILMGSHGVVFCVRMFYGGIEVPRIYWTFTNSNLANMSVYLIH